MKIKAPSLTGISMAVAMAGMSFSAVAAPNELLGIQTGNPDIYYISSPGQGCNYDGANLEITSTPLTLTVTSGDLPQFFTGATLTINAAIDASGVFSTGDLTVTGVVGSTYGSPVLTGSVTNYGIADFGATDRVEFTFNVTGGSLATDFGGIGAEGGAIVAMEGSTYVGDFAGTWACDVTKGNIGPTPLAPIGTGTGTIGYWKNHPDAWPADSVTIGGTTFSKAEAIAILKMAVKGDKSVSMAKQLIAAKLNVDAGNDSSCIDATIAASDQWLSDHGGVGSAQRQWDGGDLLHDELDAYNNGLLCAPHRD